MPEDEYLPDNQTSAKQHFDFLKSDLTQKTLRYTIHNYAMHRIHKSIFSG